MQPPPFHNRVLDVVGLQGRPTRRAGPPFSFISLCICNRVGGGVAPAVLPHHRTYGSVYGGSWSLVKNQDRCQQ